MWWLLASIWCIIYLGHVYLNRSSTSATLLPAYTGDTRGARRGANGHTRGGHAKVKTSLRFLQFKVTITSWNAAHDRLVSLLFKRRRESLAVFLEWFYDLGTVLGAVGMLVAMVVLLRVTFASGWTLLEKLAHHEDEVHILMRRALDLDDGASTVRGQTPAPVSVSGGLGTITPIIPGYTVPMSHLPIIILAVFISQAIHEFGHAIAAALSAIPLLAAGASLTLVLPAAFVSFPNSALANLRPRARARIVAAGAHHNLAFWCLLIFVAWSGVLRAVGYVSGYENVAGGGVGGSGSGGGSGQGGKAVVSVSETSPLALHLAPGAVVVRLDDTPAREWDRYLNEDEHVLDKGWCLQDTILGKADDCCTANHSSPLACFSSPRGSSSSYKLNGSKDSSYRGCIDPVPILTRPNEHNRCTSQTDCQAGATCVMPEKDAQLLRLTLHDETVVLWRGPASEVLEEVIVDDWRPRIWFLPRGLPRLLATFWEYLQMATLSLFFFNLLPLPFLDGSELLCALMDIASTDAPESSTFAFDVEALETGQGGRIQGRAGRGLLQRAKGHITRNVPYGTLGIVLSYILLSIANAWI